MAATSRFKPLARWRWFSKERSRISPSRLKNTARRSAFCLLASIEADVTTTAQFWVLQPLDEFGFESGCDASSSQTPAIIDGDGDLLLGTEIALGGLNRRMPQQELDLFYLRWFLFPPRSAPRASASLHRCRPESSPSSLASNSTECAPERTRGNLNTPVSRRLYELKTTRSGF